MRRFSGEALHTVSDEIPSAGAAFAIRKMLEPDVPAVHKILELAPEAAHWSEDSIRSSINTSRTLAFVSEQDGSIAGCILSVNVSEEAEILNLAVQVRYRRKGIATELVQHVLEEWQRQDVKRIFLEVRESNLGAINFYHRLGFQKMGWRKKYYTEPEEDALVLERTRTTK
jgi:ribosomal-protein-alanine acetyltransferase